MLPSSEQALLLPLVSEQEAVVSEQAAAVLQLSEEAVEEYHPIAYLRVRRHPWLL